MVGARMFSVGSVETREQVEVRVDCPVHGVFVYPPDAVAVQAAKASLAEHAACVPVQRRAPRKSRRSPLLATAMPTVPEVPDGDGRAAPGHLGATLGFAPPVVRSRGRAGAVRL